MVHSLLNSLKSKMKIKLILLAFIGSLLGGSLMANNVQLSNLSAASTSQISFEVSWDNAFNIDLPENERVNDGLWIFAKWKDEGNRWHHFDFGQADEVSSSNIAMGVSGITADGKGFFISPSDSGGFETLTGKITIDFFSAMSDQVFEIRFFAIEMVKIPERQFFLGDSISQNTFKVGGSGRPFLISNNDEIIVGLNENQLVDTGKYAPEANIPANYPNGYSSFWMMKYEISQDQFAGFLNTLMVNQQERRTKTSPKSPTGTYAFANSAAYSFRNGIAIERSALTTVPAIYGFDGNGNGILNEPSDGKNRAMNFLNNAALLAYLDWSGLRPMTEFEFEKACRGDLNPIKGEFAWGTAFAEDGNNPKNEGLDTEGVEEVGDSIFGLTSHGYSGVQGPLRTGFSANINGGRVQGGVSRYGIFDLSGNVWELAIIVNKEGLDFDGAAGDGVLSLSGEANQLAWKLNGVGHRGGAWNSGVFAEFRDLAVSDRFYSGLTANDRRNTVGGRGVRYE
jgi:formylglycine-generating enzyme required for sulfatase activity